MHRQLQKYVALTKKGEKMKTIVSNKINYFWHILKVFLHFRDLRIVLGYGFAIKEACVSCRVPDASRCQEHCASKLASSTTARQTSLILLSPLITELCLRYQR